MLLFPPAAGRFAADGEDGDVVMEAAAAELRDALEEFGDEAARGQCRELGENGFETIEAEPVAMLVGGADFGDAVGVEQQRRAGREGRFVLGESGDFRRECADRRASTIQLLHGRGRRRLRTGDERGLVPAAGVGQLARARLDCPGEHGSKDGKMRVGLKDRVDGGKRVGGRHPDREAVRKQFTHVLGLRGLLLAVPRHIPQNDADIARPIVQREHVMEVSAGREATPAHPRARR